MVEYEHHEIRRPEPLSYDEIAVFGSTGWAMYHFEAPPHAMAPWAFHFRRPSRDEPATRTMLTLRGGLDRVGPGLGDLVGTPPRVPIRVRRPAGRGA